MLAVAADEFGWSPGGLRGKPLFGATNAQLAGYNLQMT
jgi:hypothetical protein